MPTSFNTAYLAFRSPIATDEYIESRQQIQLASLDPYNTSDIRCSAAATPPTKATTSKDDKTGRFLAANQLFTAIRAYRGALGIKAAIGASKPELWEGRYVPTFSVTYIDGGTEKWVVSPGVPQTLVIDAHLPPEPSGDGIPKPCPMRMNG
jgi:hypothetical protein